MVPGPELDRPIAERQRYAGHWVDTNFVKVFMDGSSLGPHFTDAQLDPETDRASRLVAIGRTAEVADVLDDIALALGIA